jgi:glycosyltransferase XagB
MGSRSGGVVKKLVLPVILIVIIAIVFLTQTDSAPDALAQQDPSTTMLAPATRQQALHALADLYDRDAVAPGSLPDSGIVASVSDLTTGVINTLQDFLRQPHPEASETFIILCLLLLIPQGIFTLFWMLYSWNDPGKADQGASPQEYAEPRFSFTALLPARHEEAVIKDTIYAVNAIDYPSHLKEILVLVRDEDDDDTIAEVEEAIEELGNPRIRLITFKDGPRNKPNGLNRGLRVARNEVVCIFDAEDEPHPDIYNIVNTVMLRDDADVVQSGVQLMNIGSTWFSALNCLEYFFWFRSGLHFFTRMLRVTPLGGNTVFFKRAWLKRVGGWDEQRLTEDADIGIRMTLQGAKFQMVYDARHVTQEETPATVGQFIKQRTRWSQGFFEIFFKFDWWHLSQLRQKLGAMYILMNPLFQASMMLYLPLGIYVALTQRIAVELAWLSYIPLAMLLLQLLITVAGIRQFAADYGKRLPRFFILRMVLAYYPFQVMLALASFRAVYRYLEGNHGWEKTTHSNEHRISAQIRRGDI